MIENPRGDFLECTSYRALGLVVLLVYWARIVIKINLMGTDISMIPGTPSEERVQNRALMSEDVLATTAARQRAGVSNHGGEADSRLRGSSAPVELNNSEGHKLHDSSSRIGGNACLLPYFDDQSPEDKNRNIYSCDGQQALVGNMTRWPDGGLSREDWEL